MQVTQLLCALALWLLIWRVAPFRPYEKLLLLLSYFLFWEYFIVSRPYALMTLLGFGFIALRANRPERRIWQWLLLGLLANITLFGAIWSIGLAAFFLFQERQRWRSMLSGVAIFGSALALSIATMVPPARSYLRNRGSISTSSRRRCVTSSPPAQAIPLGNRERRGFHHLPVAGKARLRSEKIYLAIGLKPLYL